MESIIDLRIFILISFGLILGFLSAIPVGAVQLDVAKKAINGHLSPAIATVFGSVTSDFIYGTLTLFGIGHFLFHKESQIIIYIIGISVLLFLFFRSFQEYRFGVHNVDNSIVFRKRQSFLTGFTIAITNPGIIIWWIVGYKLLLDFSIYNEISSPMKIIFILSGCIGLGGYLILIASLLHRIQKSFSDNFIHKMNLILLFLLTLLIVYFALRIIAIAFNYNSNIPFFE
ncbi:MAG: LysE family transporter [Spirochaetota bacterium]|nr:LysE family transporter [Spirochaetota bacterium]